ncbi:MAG: hypothetical protein ACKO3W_01005 [bacterium]
MSNGPVVLPDSMTAPGPSQSNAARGASSSRPIHRQTSAPAIAATVALVMFSVFIGLYGPRLGNRQQLPGGTTLVELATAIEPRHAQRMIGMLDAGMGDVGLLRRAGGSGALAEDARTELVERRNLAEEKVADILGVPITLPEPPGRRVLWVEPEQVRLPGAGGALVSCIVLPENSPRAPEQYATILLLADEDRYTVFDPYGRPRPMPEGEVFSVVTHARTDLGMDGAVGSAENTIRFVRCGELVVAVQASGPELAGAMVALLEERLARRLPGSDPS